MSLIRKQLGHLLATPIGKVPPGPKGSVRPAPERADGGAAASPAAGDGAEANKNTKEEHERTREAAAAVMPGVGDLPPPPPLMLSIPAPELVPAAKPEPVPVPVPVPIPPPALVVPLGPIDDEVTKFHEGVLATSPLPFVPGAVEPSPPPRREERAEERLERGSPGETVEGMVSPFARKKALPFKPVEKPDLSFRAAAGDDQEVTRIAPMKSTEAVGANAGPVQTARERPARPDLAIASRDDDEMTAIGSASPLSAPALPFGAGSPGAPPSNRSPESRPLPPPLPLPKRSSLGSTEEERPSPFRANPLPFRGANTDAPAAGGPAPAPAPAPAPDAETLPVLSLEQYASLCAELFVFPGNPEPIFLKYRLRTQAARSAVDSYWQRRLSKEVSLYKRWQELYRQYTAYWQSRR